MLAESLKGEIKLLRERLAGNDVVLQSFNREVCFSFFFLLDFFPRRLLINSCKRSKNVVEIVQTAHVLTSRQFWLHTFCCAATAR